MDYDSSSKFISSLAKFLQSLCNGYVEFDNGVEVIGHIYLSVDTGKKIDYILNEKVCKTDENSVTFISNSFHAQPAEKPKPASKKGKGDQATDKPVDNVDNESSNEVEPRSTNVGTVARNSNRNFHSSSPSLGKRPFSPHSKVGSSGSKKSRNESQEHGFGNVSDDGSLSIANLASDPLRGHSQSSSGPPPHANSSQSYDQGFHSNIDNSIAEDSDTRDIKPSMDTDVTFVKEEFTSASCSQVEDERSQGTDGSFSSIYPSNQPYAEGGSSNQSFGQQNSRLSYGERSDMYDSSLMSSQMEGSEGGADPSDSVRLVHPLNLTRIKSHMGGLINSSDESISRIRSRGFLCQYCRKNFTSKQDLEGHVNTKHLKKKPYNCDVCMRCFAYEKTLKYHIRVAHKTIYC